MPPSSSSLTDVWALRTPAPRTPSPPPSPRRPAMSEEERLLRAVEREIERSNAARRAAEASGSPWRKLFNMATKKSKNPAAAKKRSLAPTSPPRTQQEEREPANEGADVAGRSSSVPGSSSEAGARDDGMLAGQAAALPRSGYAAMMKRALARIQGGDVGDSGEAFAEMGRAMKGLMDVSFEVKVPELPMEFVSKLPRRGKGWSQRDIIADPLILASGDSIDKFSHQWSSLGPDQPLLAAPNHVLRDVINAWCLDHSIPPPSANYIAAIDEAPPSEEEMPLLLEKLSMHSVEQQEALHRIQLLSTSSKGVQPCLEKWQDLLPKLMTLNKKWKATWSRELEEERLTVMLNLSLHRPNREILATQVQLPDVLKKTIGRAKKLGYPLATMAKVSAIIAVLSEFSVFREKVVQIGGILMLCGLLDTKDALVRNEASAAILALCPDDTTITVAVLNHVPDALLACLSDGVVTDECLLLLERTSHSEFVPDWIASSVALLMKVITRHGRGHVTSRGIQTAVCLIYNAVQNNTGRQRLKSAGTLDDFVEALSSLETKGMPLERVFQIQEILKIASEALPD
ncbi:hypothetical protein ACP70R_027070 [Stipagrostis hirtigluma subsp. patula]